MNEESKGGTMEALRGRPGIGFAWRTVALLLAMLLASQDQLKAAAGLSDILATRACWLQPPYAVSKCYSHTGGPYHADLFLGRPEQSSDLFSYDGIVHVDLVASGLSRIAVTRRYIVVEYVGSEPSFGVIDIQAGSVEPVHLRSHAELQRYLGEQGQDEQEVHFQTFEEVYYERGPWWSVYFIELICLSLLLFILGLTMTWIFRRRLGSVFRRILGRRPRAVT
ncbi:MAG TPA: hypothetical protein VN688_01600 [Gemmataceae bacterium]|nr:hypothetical protein [Gemmataceae bacterium]